MEASSPFLSREELARFPSLARAVRLGPQLILLWFADGSTSLATRAPGGELWVDRREPNGKIVRSGPIAGTGVAVFAARGQGEAQGPAAHQFQLLARTAGTV
jgi:hypothetical protein